MSSREEPPYDPYIPSGGAGGQQGGQGQNGNHRTAALQAVRCYFSSVLESSATSFVASLLGSCGRATMAGGELASVMR
jgi:hypothetical protein